MPKVGKMFRVFVSSTFSDLKAERDALQEKVFPRLRALCEDEEHRSSFQAIDLRWGVGKESSLDQKTMKICLDELARCQEMSPKPNFIVLLGDRYGWRPLPYEIEATEFEEVIKHVDKEEDLIHKWYKRDDNAIPPVYLLQPVKEDDKEEWDKEEKILHAALLAGAREAELAPLALFKYESSATEQEIEAGALSVEDAEDHVFCFFRNITGLPLDAASNKYDESAHDFVDMDKDGNADEEARRMLDDLKSSLREKLDSKLKEKPNANVFEYDAAWQGDGGDHPVTRDHLDKLCDDVYASLSRIIKEEVQKLENIDPLEEEIKVHREVASEHSKFFTGRVKILDTISRYVSSDNESPLAIYGEGGMGKTALVSCATKKAKKEHPEAQIIFRFIGQTPESSDIAKLFMSLIAQIRRSYGKEETSTSQLERVPESKSYDELIQEFKACLTFSAPEKPLILFIDSLDQLSDSNNPETLSWFPFTLSENTKVIVSTRKVKVFENLKERLPEEFLLELTAMPADEGDELLDKWLEDAGRTLNDDQRNTLLKGFEQRNNPLYLKLAFEEAKLWSSYTLQVELNPTVEGIIESLYGRLSEEKSYGNMLTSRVLGYIAASRYGLSEEELIDILSEDKEVMDDFFRRSPESPLVTNLPFIVWSRFYEELAPYLVRKSAQNVSVITFYHRELFGVATARYLGGGDGDKRHLSIADYFLEKELSDRKVSELPWQLSKAESWPLLYELLCDLDFLNAAWEADEYDIKVYWAQLEENSQLRMVDAYQPVLDKPEKYQEHLWYLAILLTDTGHPMEALSLREYLVEYYRQTRNKEGLAACLSDQASILAVQGNLDGAMELYKEQEEICRELGNKAGLAISLGNQANILFARGNLEDAMELHLEEEKTYREFGDNDRLQTALGNQATILFVRGKLDGAMELYKEQERICRELGKKDGLQGSLGGQALILNAWGDLDGAMELHKEEERICRELGIKDKLGVSLGNQANILFVRGNLEGAMKLHEEEERICRELGNKDGLQACVGNQGLILAAWGDMDGAMELYKEQEEICRELGNRDGLQKSLGNQAILIKATGDLDGAMELYKEKERICRELGNKDGLGKCLHNQANILYARGDLNEAMDLYKEREMICRELRDKIGLGNSLGGQAMILEIRGDLDGAMELYKEQEGICRELGNIEGLTASLANQAIWLNKMGRNADALALAQEAYDMAKDYGLAARAQGIKQILDYLTH